MQLWRVYVPVVRNSSSRCQGYVGSADLALRTDLYFHRKINKSYTSAGVCFVSLVHAPHSDKGPLLHKSTLVYRQISVFYCTTPQLGSGSGSGLRRSAIVKGIFSLWATGCTVGWVRGMSKFNWQVSCHRNC